MKRVIRNVINLRSSYREGSRWHTKYLARAATSTSWDNSSVGYYFAISTATLAAVLYSKDDNIAACHSVRDNAMHTTGANNHVIPADSAPASMRHNDKALTRNCIADAAAVIAPSVVNIVAPSHGFIPMAQAGSGFIITKVFVVQ